MKIFVFILVFSLFACAGSNDPVVNAGSSTPIEERENHSAFDTINEQSPVVGFEFGLCSSDSDCQPRSCDGEETSICASADLVNVCLVNPISNCLSQLNPSFCSCFEGSCRWNRRPEVMQCANIGSDLPSTRGFEGSEQDLYPLRPK